MPATPRAATLAAIVCPALLTLALAVPTPWAGLLVLTCVGVAIGALVVTLQPAGGHVRTLEERLRRHVPGPASNDVAAGTTRQLLTTITDALAPPGLRTRPASPGQDRSSGAGAVKVNVDLDVLQLLALRSGDARRIRRVLDGRTYLPATLVPHLIQLLDRRDLADDAGRVLEAAASRHAGEMVDALLDPAASARTRRRLARILSTAPSPRVIDGLMCGLEGPEEPVRVECGRALARAVRARPAPRVDTPRVLACVRAAVDRAVVDAGRGDGDRGARRALAHVFTLLSLVVPAKPLRIAYRALHTGDPALRGTALEYLACVLPADVRASLDPLLDGPLLNNSRRTSILESEGE